MLAGVIERLDEKPSTQHNVAKQLNKIYNIKIVNTKTFQLTRDLLIE